MFCTSASREPDGIPTECKASSRDSGLFCGSSEIERTKIASVPATPFTWKGYAGRNFETELN
jgi:hypothetical protein